MQPGDYRVQQNSGRYIAKYTIGSELLHPHIHLVARPMNEFKSGRVAQRRKKLCHAPTLFGSTSTISRLGFRDGQYSLVGCCSAVLLLMVPHVPNRLYSGGP